MALWLALVLLLVLAGCAKYNTFYNARRAFDDAEHVREEAIKNHQDPPEPAGAQLQDYQEAIHKAQKILDDYPGHSLTDDALFLQAKAHNRLSSFRQSIKKLDLLFLNFPASEYMEEAIYIQALNYLMIGAVDRSQEFLDQLAREYPDSKFQSETLKVSGDNAYALEDWEGAARSYELYLQEHRQDANADRIGVKLAECYWELEEYQKASEFLRMVQENTTSQELAFRARLLLARVHVRLGDFEVVEALARELEEEAEVYSAEGEVVLIQAESLVAQGRGEEAAPLIESMPADWGTPKVKARAADILGYLYMQRGDLEAASAQFRTAVGGRDQLDDYNRTRRLDENLKDYLNAETALVDARPERVPRLKLLQANAMLFGFNRPGEAARLFATAGVDSAADSLLAPRGLYGAVVVYRDYLDQPDSATYYGDLLVDRFPESPQAFEYQSGPEGDLLSYLLARQDSLQAAHLASLSPEELADLEKVDFLDTGARGGAGKVQLGVRRRMVYLSRRPNLLFEPPEGAVEAARERHEARLKQEVESAAETAATDERLRQEGAFGGGGRGFRFCAQCRVRSAGGHGPGFSAHRARARRHRPDAALAAGGEARGKEGREGRREEGKEQVRPALGPQTPESVPMPAFAPDAALRCHAVVRGNDPVSTGLIRMDLELETDAPFLPGQFAMVNLPGRRAFTFGRPFSILAVDGPVLSLLYRVVGGGTRLMRDLRVGESMDFLGPLGRPFAPPVDGLPAVLIGGGVGLPPIWAWFRAHGRPEDRAYFGARDGGDAPWGLLGDRWQVSVDRHVDVPEDRAAWEGRVPDLVARDIPATDLTPRVVMACGPIPLLKAAADLARARGWSCQVSLEEHMGCGYGACKGCVVPVHEAGQVRNATCCQEGPVFAGEEIDWTRYGRHDFEVV